MSERSTPGQTRREIDPTRPSGEPLLEVTDLEKHYPITRGILKNEIGRVRAVDGISFEVYPGETLGIVGESGCGKSTAATSMLRLEDPTGGKVVFDGENILEYDEKELRKWRRRAQMIFQDPTSSFDPRMSIGQSVTEPLMIHGFGPKEKRRRIGENLLERVGLQKSDYGRYPHEFSGGQKQRIALARAMVVNPDLIVADEPTSALDVSIQSEILSLMNDIQQEYNLSLIFISHNLGVIREVCDRVAVMYLGEIVEIGNTDQVFNDPQHPYTEALLQSIPRPDPRNRGSRARLTGDVPDPSNPPEGCRFHTRCPAVIQPEGLDLDQETFRKVMDLRWDLRVGNYEVESLEEIAVAEYDFETEEDVGQADLKEIVKNEAGLPDRYGDPSASSTVDRALEEFVSGDRQAALGTLREQFETPCETTSPTLARTDTGHEAACHLVDDSEIDVAVEQADSAASD